MSRLKATIMIPAYNAGKFIGQSLKSVSEQEGFSDYDVVVVNDGSTDDTEEKIKEYAKKDSRVRIINKQNGGNASARNVLLEESTGDILFGLDADDVLDSLALKKVIDCYNQNPDINHIYTDQAEIDEQGRLLMIRRRQKINRFFWDLSYNCHFQGHLKTFRREAIGNNRFDEDLRSAVDWDFFLRILPGLNLLHLPEVLYSYRMNPSGVSYTRREEVRDNSVALVKKYLAKHKVYGDLEVEVKKVKLGKNLTYYDHLVEGKSMIKLSARQALESYLIEGE